jgi:hypothetical protein
MIVVYASSVDAARPRLKHLLCLQMEVVCRETLETLVQSPSDTRLAPSRAEKRLESFHILGVLSQDDNRRPARHHYLSRFSKAQSVHPFTVSKARISQV